MNQKLKQVLTVAAAAAATIAIATVVFVVVSDIGDRLPSDEPSETCLGSYEWNETAQRCEPKTTKASPILKGSPSASSSTKVFKGETVSPVEPGDGLVNPDRSDGVSDLVVDVGDNLTEPLETVNVGLPTEGGLGIR